MAETPEAQPQPQPTAILQFNNVKSSDFRSIYTNNTAFQLNAFDIGIIFGEIVEANEQTSVATVEQRVRIVMSPLHAKIFALVMLQNIQNYESRFGEIKLPLGAAMLRTAAGDRAISSEGIAKIPEK
jgi:hypothetical protein